ncbi:MAG: aldo/keto reductase [Candidatus Azobacteroides sp.]|nr:aldo/keto reductase [Candidatus Azobacteroides sp.]
MENETYKQNGSNPASEKKKQNQHVSRRTALKYMGIGAAGVVGAWYGVKKNPLKSYFSGKVKTTEIPPGLMINTRTDPKTGAEIPLLAYGCMRFPRVGEDTNEIDEEESAKMIDVAYQHGVRYFDTAYIYHAGMSETFIGKVLKKYPRESFFLATKMPTWMIDAPQKVEEIFEEQLVKCQVDYFDFYHLHSLSTLENYKKVYEEFGGYEYLKKQKENGRIHRLGFSFHGPREEFPGLCDLHEWDFVMIQANYYDWDIDGEFLYNELLKRNIPCMIMEPLRGGMLTSLTADATKILKMQEPDRSLAWWAMQYISSKPNILTVLSGMSAMEHVKDNILTFSDIQPLTEQQEVTLLHALEEFRKVSPIRCTECDYCMPCPVGVNIPGVFSTYNKCVRESNIPDMKGNRSGDFNRKRRGFLGTFGYALAKEESAWRCIDCQVCVELCPQHIEIPQLMKEISGMTKALENI